MITRECSSAVEHLVANEKVVSSNLITRSSFYMSLTTRKTSFLEGFYFFIRIFSMNLRFIALYCATSTIC